MPLVNGVHEFVFGEGVLTRASGAYSPDTGKMHRANNPRVTSSRIATNIWEPKVYFTFGPSTTKMEYDTTDNNLLERQAQFESDFEEFTRVTMGASFLGKPIYGYRLGPASRKHFIQVNSVHGNEIDGMNGSFKAMEILAREAEFQPFRDEFTLFFVPALNPDGWKLETRNLAQVGPNGQTVNLNRNWDWFWDEYVETADESKGSAPESTSEAQALLDYTRTANAGNEIPLSVMFDFHANTGPGARYQSRDRIWRGISEPAFGTTDLPNGRLSSYADWNFWRTMQALATLRARDHGGPDLYIRYLRSRFRPHMHAYYGSINYLSFAVEEMKVATANGFETYATASNYRLDYILTIAQMITSSNWQFDDAVLLEKAGRNIHNNSNFEQWQAEDARPGNWTTSRALITRHTHIPEQRPAPEETRLYDSGGSGLELTSDVDITLAVSEEFTRAASPVVGEVGFLLPSARNWFRYIELDSFAAAEIFSSPMTRTTLWGAGVVNSGDHTVDIIGGGSAAPSTGAVTTVTRLDTTDGAETETDLPNGLNTARMFHGCADNFLDLPTTFSSRLGWVFGGYNSVGTRLTSIEEWDPNANGGDGDATTLTATFPTGLADCVAVHDPVGNKVYIFGGSTAIATAVNTIYVYDVALDSLSPHSTTLPVALKHLAGSYVPHNKRIYLFGGEKTDGTMSYPVYVFDPLTGSIVQESTGQNLGDDEDAQDSQGGPWTTLIGRWSATTLLETAGDTDGRVFLPGGRQNSTAGTVLSTVYRYDPIDMIIGLPSESDYGYIRFSVSSVDRQYGYMMEVTKDNSEDFFRRNDSLDFSSGAVDVSVAEYVFDTDTHKIRLSVSDLAGQPDIRPGDTFTGPRGSGTVDRISYDNFPSLDEANQWNDLSGVWAGSGGAAVGSGGDGPLTSEIVPDFRNVKVSVSVRYSAGSTHDFSVVARGVYSGSTLTSGYRVRYDVSATTWILERVVASVATILASLDVTATATSQITTSDRTLVCRFEDGVDCPVHLVVVFNGASIFNIFDLSEARIVTTGQVGIEGGGD